MTGDEIVTPIVHRNGTGCEALLDQLCHVSDAVREAQARLDAACPNARDYYMAPGRYDRALAQHQWRHAQLRSVLSSLMAEAMAIAEACE